jgi:hypothetical protein
MAIRAATRNGLHQGRILSAASQVIDSYSTVGLQAYFVWDLGGLSL